ncbi:glutathione S-transferase N-terminal domain-containing protein [Halobacteriovorax sp. JY17]|uniref:glutaredoxin family protein n=1 Tax=Halobacteriovorax sp. JY17 TaxID=2014617 RepID=UPI000C40D682|nr:glutathione S-transferase N-terminal domain-containing protein [Halobacteriovorax sp. JY17]PIK13832.1 MAG: glutaredoxin [Halobacteriovorax sp. JY17]
MKLELFYYDSCPFCQYVLGAIDDLAIKVEYCNIQESQEHLNRLVTDTGRRTVPCLYINNTPMFESSDIVEWLNNNQSNLEKKA